MRGEQSVTLFPEHDRPCYGYEAVYALNALIVALLWLYFVSDRFLANGILDGVYEIQAAMLRQGQLFIVPGPLSLFYHDALMYWGEYYFYWGMLPSGLFLVLSALFGRVAGHYLTVFLFLFSLVYFFQRLVAELLEAASPDESPCRAAQCVGCLIFTWVVLFAVPYPVEQGWFFGRFAVYEQQVLFGLALGFPGLYFLMRGLRKRRLVSVSVGTVFFCLAAWTRVTWFPWAVLALVGTAFLRWSWGNDDARGSGKRLSLLVLGAGSAMILGLVFLNDVRFGSFTDFGVRYQNPGHYLYFRNLKMFFSPVTRLWNCLFNIMSYYAAPTMVENLGLAARSFAFCEGFPPSFFYFNPQFLLLVVIFPLGMHRLLKNHSRLIVPFVTLAVAALYLHFIVGFFGTFVILRYFVEFYYLTALVFLCILLMLVRPGVAVLLLVAMVGVYIPGTVRNFIAVTPELRTANWSSAHEITSGKGATPFIEQKAAWPQGTFSAREAPNTPPYAATGVRQGGPGTVLGTDIFAVYLVPGEFREGTALADLSVRELRSLVGKGTARFFFEDRLIGSMPLEPDKPVDVAIELPFTLPRSAPYQVMVVFLQEGFSYLPGRTSGKPVLAFREISLRNRPL
jgi:hypothetical protein